MKTPLTRVATVVTAMGIWVEALAAGDAIQPPPRITAGLVVSSAGPGLAVAFTVSRPCDVTVRIMNAAGGVVRHLVSGMVGLDKAAEPLAPGTLAQRISWDGRDDAGNPAPAGCSVRVAVGMRAEFDKFILWEKDACPKSRGNNYGASTNGDCYVNQSSGVHLDTLRLFDRDGRLIRQVWPPSLNRPRDVLQPFLVGRWGATDWDGDSVPLKVCHNSWYVFGVRSGGMAQTTDGYLVSIFAGVGEGVYAMDPNDFPRAWHWTPPWYTRGQDYKTRMQVAAGTDGDFYLADDFQHVVGRFRASDMSPIHSFTHAGGQPLDKARFYIGDMGKQGDDEGHFNGPNAVALDAEGNLCILDGAKVKVYAKTGAFLREAGKDAFPARAIPPAVRNAEKVERSICFPQFLRVREDGKLIIMNHGAERPVIESDVEGKEFKAFALPWGCEPYHGFSSFDREGNWYTVVSARNKPQEVWKFEPGGKRGAFGDKEAIVIQHEGDAFALSKGICVATNGDLYVVVQTDKWKQKAPGETGGVAFGDLSARGAAACQTRVDVYGPDGALKRKGIVQSVGINDVAVDREGNLYVIEGTMWHGAQMGGVARGEPIYGKSHWPFPYLTPEQAALDPKTQANKRYSLLSRLVKFPARGGILDDAGDQAQSWNYAGVSGVSPWNCDAECPASQICIDPDERIWVPDSFMYCVKAVDKAGNEILRVGKYGNEDCRGGGGDRRHPDLASVVIDPEIPLSCPKGMAVYRDWLFISDMFAHRVMRCRLAYADTKEIALK